MVKLVINSVDINFWLEVERAGKICTLYCNRNSEPMSVKYPIWSITNEGECFRHPGLPDNYGFSLTVDGKIREIR